MKRILIVVSLLFVAFSCGKNESESKHTSYCTNELNLLCSFDTIPILDVGFRFLHDSIEGQMNQSLDLENCCEEICYNVYYFRDSLDPIKLSVYWKHPCENGHFCYSERVNCSVLINSYGNILFDQKIVSIDSLSTALYNYYLEAEQPIDNLEAYRNVNLTLQWDKGVSQENFSEYITQIVKGYLRYVERISEEIYGSGICQLDRIELEELSKIVPWNVELYWPREIVVIND